jgi:hypothetical protein
MKSYQPNPGVEAALSPPPPSRARDGERVFSRSLHWNNRPSPPPSPTTGEGAKHASSMVILGANSHFVAERPLHQTKKRSFTRSFQLSVQAAALTIGLTIVATAAHSETPTLDGQYTLDAKVSDDMNKVIEAYIANTNFVVRSVARGQFKTRHPAYARVQIAHTATEVVVTFDEANPMRLPMDGKIAQWKREDGEMLDMKGQWQSNQLIQIITHDAWKRTNDFRISADGNTLTLNVDFFQQGGVSDKPMLYRLVYRRDMGR